MQELSRTSPSTPNSVELLGQFDALRDFTRIFFDGFVLIDNDQRPLRFNQPFCSFLGLRAVDMRRIKHLSELLDTRNEETGRRDLDDLLSSPTPTRADELAAINVFTKIRLSLIVSTYPFHSPGGERLGTCLLIRDVTAESTLQGKYTEKAILSVTDPLSGLYTRRYFEEWLDGEIARKQGAKQTPEVAILMFDLDRFKHVNDTYGHQAGDYVIAETARVLKTTCRNTDICGRYGGEELLVLLTSATPQGACTAAEKFRVAIAAHEFRFEGTRIPVTASVGVTVFLSPDESREGVIARVDKCLYAAKEHGRNVVFANLGDGEVQVPFLAQGKAS